MCRQQSSYLFLLTSVMTSKIFLFVCNIINRKTIQKSSKIECASIKITVAVLHKQQQSNHNSMQLLRKRKQWQITSQGCHSFENMHH